MKNHVLDMAEALFERFPNHRVEVLGGEVSVEPLPDGRHARILTDVMRACWKAGLDDEGVEVFRQIGIWLPTGPADFAMPDVSIVDAASDDHMVTYNCYDPKIFRLVLEVTTAALSSDLTRKPAAYASAGVPAYVVVDREERRVVVMTRPEGGMYRERVVRRPGQAVALPGTGVVLSVEELFR
ncbi:Uma2 family endonuclease [Kitasatospora sp. NPDC051170]|uniref:Uma2 family endonuclease n=1 Tax=Kitasatospora sp. NPDC051170 TaxID=3364056 RepID=UPI00379632BF